MNESLKNLSGPAMSVESNIDEIDTITAPPRIAKEAFESVDGQLPLSPQRITEMVQLACHKSEASPEAVALNTIAFFCALIGRDKVTYQWGDTFTDPRPSILIVGDSGSNKGISEHLVRKVFKEVENGLQHQAGFMPLDLSLIHI